MKEDKLQAKNWNLLKLQRYQQQNHAALIRLGVRSWESMKYKGTLYDYDTPIGEFLKHYASQYDSVEYHGSFTDIPSARRLKAMKEEVEVVNKEFKFCPVVPRSISHESELGRNPYDLKDFLENISVLDDHLGPCIWRLPETFSPLSLQILMKFLLSWPSGMKLALQFTHPEWFKKSHALKTIVKELQGRSISILVEDRVGSPSLSENLLMSDHLLVRFYGRPQLNQDDQRLAMWVYKLGEYKAYGIKDSYFFLYEQEEMCLSILRKMAIAMGGNVRVPAGFDVSSKQMGFSF
jgi:uncharacterized protein YecE (DUF72 family)